MELILGNRSSKGSLSPTGYISCSVFATKKHPISSIWRSQTGSSRCDPQSVLIRPFRSAVSCFGVASGVSRTPPLGLESIGTVSVSGGVTVLGAHRGCQRVGQQPKKTQAMSRNGVVRQD